MITQDNLFALLPGIISNIVKIIAEEENLSLKDATLKFYSSETYSRLENAETEFWHLGAAQLWEEYRNETCPISEVISL